MDFIRIAHAIELDRQRLEQQHLEDRLNAWELWFEDVQEVLGIGEPGTYATADSTRDALNAIRKLMDLNLRAA
jgi:hypothetical protein